MLKLRYPCLGQPREGRLCTEQQVVNIGGRRIFEGLPLLLLVHLVLIVIVELLQVLEPGSLLVTQHLQRVQLLVIVSPETTKLLFHTGLLSSF